MKHLDERLREQALRVCEELGNTPEVRRRVAAALGVSERTLRRWAKRRALGQPLVRRRGRPPTAVAWERRQALLAWIARLGPGAGVPVLRGLFRDVPYRFLARFKRRFVRAMQRRRGFWRRRLVWARAGAVWASDFTHPAAPLERDDNRLCLVRDLSSGAQLAAAPCRNEPAAPVLAVLATLFAVLGPPLVLKHDNGGGFIAHDVVRLLDEHGVVPLRSPPNTPQYNGACERAGGSLKGRIAHAAALHGHDDRWTDADIADALLLANATARPHGANAPTPLEALAARRPITPAEREAFQQTRARAIQEALATRDANGGTMPTCAEHAAIVRNATQHALCEHGYLTIRRGRISTPVLTWRADVKA